MAHEPIVARRAIDVAAPPSTVWEVIVSPAYWPKWMQVAPAVEPGRTTVGLGSEVNWQNERGETYLSGTVTTLDPERCFVLELDDVSWKRRAAPGEVTYSLAIRPDGQRTHVDFRLGDLAIDPEGQEWAKSYDESRELEKIKELAESKGSRG